MPRSTSERPTRLRVVARRALRAALTLAVALVALSRPASGTEADPDLPVIVDVHAPAALRVGDPGELSLTYRAPRANVVAVVQVVEVVEGPITARATRQRQFSVVARAYGHEAGTLAVPLSFSRPGRSRVTLTLVTDERETSESAVVYVDAVP